MYKNLFFRVFSRFSSIFSNQQFLASKTSKMINLAFAQYLTDVTGSILSIPLNILLIFAIFKTSEGKLQPYSYLFLAGACFDVFFGVVELATQHVSFLGEIWRVGKFCAREFEKGIFGIGFF
jgi:hypothetical protein